MSDSLSIFTGNENSGYEFDSTFAQMVDGSLSGLQSDVASAAFTFLSELSKKYPNVKDLPSVVLDYETANLVEASHRKAAEYYRKLALEASANGSTLEANRYQAIYLQQLESAEARNIAGSDARWLQSVNSNLVTGAKALGWVGAVATWADVVSSYMKGDPLRGEGSVMEKITEAVAGDVGVASSETCCFLGFGMALLLQRYKPQSRARGILRNREKVLFDSLDGPLQSGHVPILIFT